MTEEEKTKHIVKLLETTNRILYILETDSKTNDKGLVEKVNEMEKTLNIIVIENKARNISSGFIGGISAGIIAFVVWFIKLLITKEP